MRELQELIKKMVAEGKVDVTTAKVVSVNKAENTCVVISTGTEEQYNDVLLQAIEGTVEKPFVTYPKADSVVGIIPLFGSKSMWMVFLTSEVDEIQINGAEFGGIAKTEQVAERLKRLEDGLESLQTKFNTHTHVTACGAGAGSANATTAQSTVSVTPKTTQEYISNEKVKHG